MFKDLSQKLEVTFKKLRGLGKLTEKNISDAMREVRRSLLEADVNFIVVKKFINSVKEKALGQEVINNIAPGQQVIKVVHDEMAKLMGGERNKLNFSGDHPHSIMLVGLQGSGKTTTAGKLAVKLRSEGYNPLLIAADVYRPAAITQLQKVGKSIGVEVYSEETKDAPAICNNAVKFAKENNHTLCIFDTAGRQHVDDGMMDEALKIRNDIKPHEILFVADAMTGQDAVNSAKAFSQKLNFTGVVLTKMDGDARGGAALSILGVTGCPIKFIGTSEKMDGIEEFHPDRMASRILGMGDIVSLVEKAQNVMSQEEAQKLEQKMRKNAFTLEDFLSQIKQIKKMGPLQDIIGMIPGMNKMKGLSLDENAFKHTEAVISSMTLKERDKPNIIDGSRRKRIAKGSGTSVQEVNRLLKQFAQMQKMLKQMNKGSGKLSGLAGGFPF